MYHYGFLSGEKDSGMKLRMLVRLLSGMSFSHFELWLTGSHSGGITSGMYAATNWMQAAAPGEARWGFGIRCRGSVWQSELGAAALLKAVWWDLRLASLLMHLSYPYFTHDASCAMLDTDWTLFMQTLKQYPNPLAFIAINLLVCIVPMQ